MLAGDDVDTAAARAGYKSSGRTSAANQLARAMRCLGLAIVGDARDRVRGAGISRRGVGAGGGYLAAALPCVEFLPPVVACRRRFVVSASGVARVQLGGGEFSAVGVAGAVGYVERGAVRPVVGGRMTRAEQVERDERRRARRAWQAVQRQAQARADWLPPVSNPEWRARDNSPRDGRDWTASGWVIKAAAGAVVSFHPDQRTFNSAGVLGVWS
jgi:hypothetical protein